MFSDDIMYVHLSIRYFTKFKIHIVVTERFKDKSELCYDSSVNKDDDRNIKVFKNNISIKIIIRIMKFMKFMKIMKMVQLDKCFILFSVYLNIKIGLKKKVL